jgi:hypothetical protein
VLELHLLHLTCDILKAQLHFLLYRTAFTPLLFT